MADSPDRNDSAERGGRARSTVSEPSRGGSRSGGGGGSAEGSSETGALNEDVFGGVEAQTVEMDPGVGALDDDDITAPQAATSSMSYGGIIGDLDGEEAPGGTAERTWPPTAPQRSPDPLDLDRDSGGADSDRISLGTSLSDEDATLPISPLSNDPDVRGAHEQPARSVSLPSEPRTQEGLGSGSSGVPISARRSPLPADLEATLPESISPPAVAGEPSGPRGAVPGDQDEPTEETDTPRGDTDENSARVIGVVFDGESSATPADGETTPPPLPGLESSEELDAQIGGEVSPVVRDGIRALRKGDRAGAIALFERALRSDPDDAMAQAYLSLAHDLLVRDLLPGARKTSVPRLRVGREMLMTLDLDPSAGMVLSMVDGMMTLEEIETMLQHMDRETIYRHLARAQEDGLVEIAS